MKHAVRGLAALSMVSVMLVGCGGSGGGAATNGEDKKPAAQIQKDAATALKSAHSVHVTGVEVDNGKQSTVDLKFQGADSTGTITQDGHKAEIIKVGGQTFLKADRGFYESMGAGAAADLGAGRWVKESASSATGLFDVTVQNFADGLGSDPGGAASTISQGTLDGRKVIVMKGKDGTIGYIANTGAPVPLRFEKPGSNGGRFTFADYGKDFGIRPPADAVTLPGG
jgi:hypothetical protein